MRTERRTLARFYAEFSPDFAHFRLSRKSEKVVIRGDVGRREEIERSYRVPKIFSLIFGSIRFLIGNLRPRDSVVACDRKGPRETRERYIWWGAYVNRVEGEGETVRCHALVTGLEKTGNTNASSNT